MRSCSLKKVFGKVETGSGWLFTVKTVRRYESTNVMGSISPHAAYHLSLLTVAFGSAEKGRVLNSVPLLWMIQF